jgi:hypothetical protein
MVIDRCSNLGLFLSFGETARDKSTESDLATCDSPSSSEELVLSGDSTAAVETTATAAGLLRRRTVGDTDDRGNRIATSSSTAT